MHKVKWKNIIIILLLWMVLMLTIILGITYIKINDRKTIVKQAVTITEQDSIASAVKKVNNAVVVVETFQNNRLISTGTGFIYKTVGENGYILTNNHVIANGDYYKIIFNFNKTVTATLAGSDDYSDIAVLKIPSSVVKTTVKIGNSEKSEVGDTVFTIGAPVGTEYIGTVTKGILSGKDRIVTINTNINSDATQMRVMQTDAAINPGNSGGPLLNINGEVIGINSLKLVEQEIEGMGFAIPIEDVIKYTPLLEIGKKIERPYLGLGVLDLNENYALYQQGIEIPDNLNSGVVISKIYENSPSQGSVLKTGDIIIKINNIVINDKAKLRYALYQHKIGDKITIYYQRGGKTDKVILTLVKQPN